MLGPEHTRQKHQSSKRRTAIIHSRVTPIQIGTNPDLSEIEQAIAGARGRISPLYQILLNSKPVVWGWEKLLTAIRQKTSLDAHLRELIILRIALLNGAVYEYQVHLSHAKEAGLSAQKIEALNQKNNSPAFAQAFDPVEQLTLRYTDAMTQDIRVSDDLFEALRPHFDATVLVELTATIAAYNMVSRFLVALDIHEETE